tara:strand:- start:1831 stop:2007 length:177 start_codon:yes stop_codon:yes gene_type:complete
MTERASCSSDLAFDKAIESGRLSDDETADNYAGDYMFMGSAESVDLFKHRDTRQYLPR